ncbi:MAG: tRNA lysidine(34) synthetase TilS [Polyangiaceae bacterium]
MSRTHPPTLETLVRRLILERQLIQKGDRVVIGVSGGPDSIALLHVLARLKSKMGFELVAHGVDHGLRAEAASELELAGRLAERLGVEWGTTRVDVAAGGNLQERARQARHRALRAAADAAGAELIATAHHADDRAETVVMRMLRGTGPRGLACLLPREGDRIRPMLLARRSDVMVHVERHQLEVAMDPSNRNPRFLRTRVREEVLPLLESLSPGVVANLTALSDDLSLLDPEAFPSGLRRAHRDAARRAAHLGQQGAVVRVSGGGDARVSVQDGSFVLARMGSPVDAS